MSALDQVVLLTLGFVVIVTAEGKRWNVSVPQHINTTWGSDVTIQCTFTDSKEEKAQNVKVYWKQIGPVIPSDDLDKNPFIYHPNSTLVLEKFRNRTRLIGDPTTRNCSLQILNMRKNESDIYVRLVQSREKWSFRAENISIFVSGERETEGSDSETQMYVGIFVPVALLVIILITTGIFCFVKHKRSHSFTREESGYYANFSRPSSNQAKSEVPSIKYEKTPLPEPKAIDEPVYINTEEATAQMESTDLAENIYINFEYSK